METKVKEVVALVTGGASGIGKVVVEMIISNGGKVVIADIDYKGKSVAISLGKNAAFIYTDVIYEKSVDDALQYANEKFGKVNVVVNSAGILGGEGSIYNLRDKPHSLDEYKKIFELNTFGAFNVMTRSIRFMKKNEPDDDGQRGIIINLGSVTAYGIGYRNIAYCSSKAIVMEMTKTAARRVASEGIRVVTIAPGAVETPLIARSFSFEAVREYLKETMFPKKSGKTVEVAPLIKYIIDNHYINPEIIHIDPASRPRNK